MTLGLIDIEQIEPALADASWETHYENEAGVVTYRYAGEGGVWFVKVVPRRVEPTVEAEAERLSWARRALPVPEVVGTGRTASGTWLLTRGLPGLDATRVPRDGDPEWLVRALARGLRRIHAVPIAPCPFSFRLDRSLARAEHRVRAGRVEPARCFHPVHAHLSAEDALARLHRTRPASEDLVVCHGDYCLPNALLCDGEVTGFVDLGGLGVADRWWDLAIATWSVKWNLGPDHQRAFLDEYGVALDPARRDFYRLLYDVVT